MTRQHTTVPSLSGTLAKCSKPTLQSNFTKELYSPYQFITRTEIDYSKMKENNTTDKNRKPITRGIVNYRYSVYLSSTAHFKSSCNLIQKCFEIGKKHTTKVIIYPKNHIEYDRFYRRHPRTCRQA